MIVTFNSIFKLSVILDLIATIILLFMAIIGQIEVPTPALIILTSISVILVSMAYVMSKRHSKSNKNESTK